MEANQSTSEKERLTDDELIGQIKYADPPDLADPTFTHLPWQHLADRRRHGDNGRRPRVLDPRARAGGTEPPSQRNPES